MALVSCADCGREISDQASACPQCGRPLGDGPAGDLQRPRRRHRVKKVAVGCLTLWVFGALVIFISQRATDPSSSDEVSSPVDADGSMVCRASGARARTVIAMAADTRDRDSLLSIARARTRLYPEANGVEVVFFTDPTWATCNFPLGDSAVASLLASYYVNRHNGSEALNFVSGKEPRAAALP